MDASETVPGRGPAFAGPGTWLKGNLHCHTTESDGALSPSDAAAGYAALGHDFLALTDHDRITDPQAVDAHGLILVPSVELTAADGELGTEFHLLGIGIAPGITLPPPSTSGAVSSAWLRAHGAATFVAHPHWSGLTTADVLALQIDGLEVMNTGTVLDSLKGDGSAMWDEGLLRGRTWSAIATDDTHWHTIERGRGWTMIHAEARTPEAIVAALRAGRFYASTGPEIHDAWVEVSADGRTLHVHVRTSPVAAIYVSGPGTNSGMAYHPDATQLATVPTGTMPPMITAHDFTIDLGRTARRPFAGQGSGRRHVRVACMDWMQRRAWTNPILF
jgi:hypothetical protein